MIITQNTKFYLAFRYNYINFARQKLSDNGY